ncbi:Cadherin-like protein [Pochonia chlamydosporia 170]|uniref:Cadherin-like protein n=1 Tax=Pochonia chlamydosporia 170 TaxID=1380566 RepID=A0A179F8E8_METCM|nr:Cadherin-like protein [Pochonia chlamydosporia 170]OAQ61765.1 Cadherin-like protein [Pochonia chlamydosporia 170]
MPSLLAVVALLPLSQLVSSEPTISFPFNAQLPLAARIDQFFSYSFAQYTFQSDSKISYSLGDHPSWLSIESGGRRLYGTPKDGDVPAGDVVGQTVDIIATDNTGSTTMNATVVVSRQPAPKVQIPLEDQIKNFGKFSAPSSILSYPSTNFKFSFDKNTFGKSGLNYYAVSGDSSPLPAWVKFDAQSLTFSGRTPPFESLIQPPQTFDLSLVASDIVGFSASSLKFSVVVGSHKLTTDQPIITLNATRGTAVNYNGLENGIKLDGKQIAPGDLTVTTKNLPTWLSYDDKTGRLQGTPKDGDHAANFTITYKDSFSDNLDVSVVVNVATGLFEATFEDMKVRPGGKFDLDMTKYFKDPSDITVKVSTSPGEDWLKVNGLKLSGDVPKTSKGDFKLIIDAASKSSDLSEKEVVNVTFLALDGTTTTVTSPSSTTTTTATATNTGEVIPDDDQTQPGRLSTGEILLATIIPVIFVAILLMVLVCYFRRRRAGKSYLGSKYRSKISHPVLSTLRVNGSDPSMREAARMGAFVHTETQVFKPAKAAFPDGHSPISSQRRSSETLAGLSESEMPQSMMVDAARTTTIRSVSNVASEDGRQSWVTIEGGHGGVAPSDRSSRSQQSDVTYPESTRQIFPGTDYAPRRDPGLEITLPTLDELPSLQPTPLLAYNPPRTPLSQHSTGNHSAITSSSAALPAQDDHYTTAPMTMTKWPTGSTTKVDASEPNWVTLAESEAGESISSLRRPDAAAVRPSRPWHEATDSADGGKSFTTDISFGSSENWRLIGRHSPTKTERSYKELVDEIPFHPSRPGTARDGAQPGERAPPSPELVSPIQWDEVPSPLASGRLGPSVSILSKMSADRTQMSGGRGHDDDTWMRDHSGKMSDGSFKVFL